MFRLRDHILFCYRKMSTQMIKVKVKQGVVVGQSKTLPNGDFYNSFQGIPYAKPPLGELRFKSPVPLSNFDVSELLCLEERDVCHQRDPITAELIGSENCLHLNVYAPQTHENLSSLPVIVFIHGGGFWFGSGNSDYYLPLFLLQEQVVVVTLNYRLGAWGFLALPEEGIWGNAGLKDQRLALQWIQDNIAQFKGDPNNVTLMGESAGAASVHLHMFSPHREKLFHKAVLQSGTANMEWVFQTNPGYKTRRLAELLGYKGLPTDTKQLLNFLQNVQPVDVWNKTADVLTAHERRIGLPFAFKPIIEDPQSVDAFITQPLLERLQQANVVSMPVIMGYNSSEGLTMLVNVVKKMDMYENDLARLVPQNLPLHHKSDIEAMAQRMRDFYLKGQPLQENNLQGMKDLLTDFHFVMELQNAAELHVKHQHSSPLYFYRFDYVGKRNFYKTLLQMQKFNGACHADELFYLFQMSADEPATFDSVDMKVCKQMAKLWASFAYAGEPTPKQRENPLKCLWHQVKNVNTPSDAFQLQYLHIDGNDGEMKCNPDEERMKFWRQIYREYKADDYSRLSSKL